MHFNVKKLVIFITVLLFPMYATALITVAMYSTKNPKKKLGDITFKNTVKGLLITPNLRGLKPGMHGLHLHENASCKEGGKLAGGHFDPYKTGKHLGPYQDSGHLGDMPILYVNSSGFANISRVAPRLKEIDIYNHAVMIHRNSDNYSDIPIPLGGGGARVACGYLSSKRKK